MVAEVLDQESLVERIDVVLHGLCQPLTVLQCRLALGRVERRAGSDARGDWRGVG